MSTSNLEHVDETLEHGSQGREVSEKKRDVKSSLIWAKLAVSFQNILHWARRHWIFMVVVVLPTVLMAFYLWVVATPQYISETHFLVRGKSINSSPLGGISSLLESSHGGTQDTYAIQDYMMSRDALRMLEGKASVRAIFNRSYADFIAKFPSIFTRHDFESFYDFYRSHVKAQLDQETGISHLTVRSFSAEDSQRVARVLLYGGEKLVNEMNDRQRYNTLHAAQEELNSTLKELHDTELKLAAYRYNNSTIDPMKQAIPMVGIALSLETTLSMVEAEKRRIDLNAPNSPLRSVYAQRIESIKAQIKQAQSHITGQESGSLSLVPKLLAYDELEIKKTIIEKKIAAEAGALEMAKAQADRQMLYVTVVSQPSQPDFPQYPRSTLFLIMTFLSALTVYATGALLISGAREHALQ